MNPKAIKVVVFVWIFVLSIMNSRPMRAQVAGGTLSGSITDPSGQLSLVHSCDCELSDRYCDKCDKQHGRFLFGGEPLARGIRGRGFCHWILTRG